MIDNCKQNDNYKHNNQTERKESPFCLHSVIPPATANFELQQWTPAKRRRTYRSFLPASLFLSLSSQCSSSHSFELQFFSAHNEDVLLRLGVFFGYESNYLFTLLPAASDSIAWGAKGAWMLWFVERKQTGRKTMGGLAQQESHHSLSEVNDSPDTLRAQTMGPSRGLRGGPKQRATGINTRAALLSILAAAPIAMAQNCIPLTGSTQCPAFQSASISVDSTLVGFLYVARYPKYKYLANHFLRQSIPVLRLEHGGIRSTIEHIHLHILRLTEVRLPNLYRTTSLTQYAGTRRSSAVGILISRTPPTFTPASPQRQYVML